ncbi:hypothetical protein J6590_037027 [Homalodisca vitripennis]|nr:hypothetical protein J6590_037027 [Homalodisca vitripennis]
MEYLDRSIPGAITPLHGVIVTPYSARPRGPLACARMIKIARITERIRTCTISNSDSNVLDRWAIEHALQN